MAAPLVVGSATTFAAAASGATITLAKPTGMQTGDLLVAVLRTNGSTSPDDFAASGWTRHGSPFVPSSAAERVTGLHIHPVADAASEPAEYVFTKSVADSRRVGALFIVRGVDLTDPIAGESVNANSDANPTIQLNSYSVDTADPTLQIYAWANEVVAPNVSEPISSPGTQIALVPSAAGTSVTRSTVWVGSEPLAAIETGAKSLTWDTSTSGSAATGMTLRGKADVTIGLPVKVGTGATAYASVLVGGERVTPASISTWLPGFSDVAALLAKPGATWAHRGGSADWPEMSEYAYDHAVRRGYGVLEFSAQRSSDGVWFGMHNNDFDYISGVTGSPAPASLTWAEINSTYRNTLFGMDLPLYRLDDFIDKYGESHVLVLDPKNGIGTFDDDFLDLLDAHTTPDHAIVKFIGNGGGGAALADKAKARGYTGWGFYYANDIASGALAEYESHWDLLGMEWDADQTIWDTILGYGKQVVAHIVPDQVAYNAAIAKGAAMAQVGGVSLVAPVSSWG